MVTTQSVVSLSAPNSVLYGGAVRLTGGLLWDNGPLGGRTVALFAQKSGSLVWSRLGSATTSASGAYGFSVKPLGSTRYRVGYAGPAGSYSGVAGIAGIGGGYSVVRTVSVRPTVSMAGNRTSMRLGTDASLTAAVGPSHRGSTVYLQRWNGASWVGVTSRTLTATSTTSAGVRPPGRGRSTYRWVLPAHRDHGLGVSRSFTLSVS